MNYLITRTGRKVDCNHGQTHEQICDKLFGMNLSDFLKKLRGVRVKLHGEECSIECYGEPNPQQIGRVNGILRKNDVFKLVMSFRGGYDVRSSFARPIRRI